jgi:DNA-binding NarL/FixJ family response regulator
MRVVVADDQAAVRGGLVTLIETLAGFEVVGDASNGDAPMALVDEKAPDVVLMDLRMPGVDGIEATRPIRQAYPATRVVVLTTYADDASIFGTLQAGAIGYLIKDAGRDDIRRALEAAPAGQAFMDPQVQARLLQTSTLAAAGTAAPPDGLAEPEVEVLRLMAAGLSNPEISKQLYVSEATVKTHIDHIFIKTNSRDRSQAVAYAHRRGSFRKWSHGAADIVG